MIALEFPKTEQEKRLQINPIEFKPKEETLLENENNSFWVVTLFYECIFKVYTEEKLASDA
jgi:hypothetical protein